MSETRQRHADTALATAFAVATAATTMLVLDLLWLGVLARGLYDSLLGPLKRTEVLWPAAALFYAMYVVAVVAYAVTGSSSPSSALRRGAALGLVTYATYELTNWAVVREWPALLVPIDVGWGVALTAVVGLAGKLVHTEVLQRKRRPQASSRR